MGEPIRPTELNLRRVPSIDAREMRPVRPAQEAGGQSFQAMLAEAVTEVQRLQDEADLTIKKLVSGELKDVTEAMVAVEKADVSFQTMMTVRNKVMQAYEEIMRTQI